MTQDLTIDEYFSKYKGDINQLSNLCERFVTISTSGDQILIDFYLKKIQDACKKCITEEELSIVEGLENLSLALAYFYKTKFLDAIEVSLKSIALLKHSPFQGLYNISLIIYGSINRSLGRLDIAVEYLIKGSNNDEFSEELKEYHFFCYYQLAEINLYIKDIITASEYYNIAIKIATKENDSRSLFRANIGLAGLYLYKKQLDLSYKHLQIAYNLKELSNSSISRLYCDYGIYYYEKEDYLTSLKWLTKSLIIRVENQFEDASSTSLINLGKTYFALGKNKKALSTLNKALIICKKNQSRNKLLNCYFLLAKIYQEKKMWKKSSISYSFYNEINTELRNEQLQNIYDLKNNRIRSQKLQIESVHKEIKDSINSAERIQRSFLASKELLDENLKDYIILFLPKATVSGDFYWASKLSNGKFTLVTADSTGHGVPGAIMSMLNISSLEKAVDNDLLEPSEIFNYSRDFIINKLKTDGSIEGGKDGMDASIICFDFINYQFSYATAQNPIWIIRDKQLIQIKAERMPIGKHDNDTTPFSQGVFEMKKNDIIYTLTDGFQDQFGGDKGKKFKGKQLRELLISISDLPMKIQRQKLLDSFTKWKGNLEQIDDICLIGIKIQ